MRSRIFFFHIPIKVFICKQQKKLIYFNHFCVLKITLRLETLRDNIISKNSSQKSTFLLLANQGRQFKNLNCGFLTWILNVFLRYLYAYCILKATISDISLISSWETLRNCYVITSFNYFNVIINNNMFLTLTNALDNLKLSTQTAFPNAFFSWCYKSPWP